MKAAFRRVSRPLNAPTFMTMVSDMQWNRNGVTREVFLTKRYAFKVPKLTYGWRAFLNGLLANIQEREYGKCNFPECCPVIFSIRGGWLIVMPRADDLSDREWLLFNPKAFCTTNDYTIPTEAKKDSFGKINGRIVAIDYGS